MPGLKFFFGLFLVLVCFPSSETRSPNGFSNKSNPPLQIESAKMLFKARMVKQVESTFKSDPNRLSPGGPDPHHH
ncbi:CLAVATA3/ESR (CLE)-related protein [Fagus crenata]